MRKFLIKLLFKDEVLQELVKDLYCTIGADDILNTDGEWTVGGKAMQEAEIKQLQAEATLFLGTRLWKYMQKDIKYRANKKMYEESKTAIDLIAGKLWLYTLDCQKSFLKKITK